MRRLCLALALALPLAAAPLSAVTITILHTSDLHGRVHPHDALADEDLGEGLARVATAVRSIRADGNPTLLLDSGDTIQGAPEQALAFAARGDASDPIVRAMNLIGYDAMAIGNHEFDFGLARLEKSARQARFPFLLANVKDAYDATLFPQYVILEAGGVRVGVIGFVTPHVPNWESPRLIEGLQFGDAVAVARRLVPSLRNQDRCDVIVILTHQGFERDPATGEERGSDRGENQAYALATEVPGVDFVLAGHAHAVVAPRQITGTWVSEPGRWGNTLTRYDVTLEKAGARWKITDVQGRNLHMKNVPPDPAVAAVVAPEHDAAMRALGEELALLETPVSAQGARSRDTGLLDWLHQVQLSAGKAQLSFGSLLPAQLPDWPAGPLTLRQVWAFYPYENSLVTVEATGKQVRAALERSAGCVSRPSELGRNCDSLAGAEYVLDLSRPEGSRIVSLTRGGKDMADDEVFTVAINSYRASGGGGYPMWKSARRVSEGGNVRDLLAADARAKKRLRLEADGNWKVVGKP